MTTIQNTSKTKKIYIYMAFSKLANDINSGEVKPRFDGKGRKIVSLTEAQELCYFYYSSDKAGEDKITPPFEINNGDNIKFKLKSQAEDGTDTLSYKWKGISQNCYDLKLVSGEKSTYNADVATGSPSRNDDDEVNITIHFKLHGDKFSVTWDPRVKIKR